MRRTVLLLDASESMNSASDYVPSRLLAVWKPVACLAAAFLDADPLARISVIVLRDGIARRVCAPTSSAADIERAIRDGYAGPRGSGAFSLTNGLHAVMQELGCGGGGGHKEGESSSGGGADGGVCMDSVIALCGSVTSVDADDVFRVVDAFRGRYGLPPAPLGMADVPIDPKAPSAAAAAASVMPSLHVISLDGAPHVLQHVANATGGELLCPVNPQHLARHLLSLVPHAPNAQPQQPADETPRRANRRERRRGRGGGGDDAGQGPVLEPVGLMASTAGEGDDDAPECPLCGADAPPLPAPCRACGTPLVDMGEAVLASYRARQLTWVPVVNPVTAAGGAVSCDACGEPQTDVAAAKVFRCDVCEHLGSTEQMCARCCEVGANEALCCPLCGALGD